MTLRRRAAYPALALLSVAALVLPGTTALAHGGGSRVHEVDMTDDCDPVTFPTAAQCTGDGDTTFDELVEELLEDGEHGKWRNRPEKLTARHGDGLVAHNVGGEPHTFTEVQDFGGGCIPELNELLGLTPVPECADPGAFPATFVLPGAHLEVGELDHGTHRFQCLIHPWMHTTVTVR